MPNPQISAAQWEEFAKLQRLADSQVVDARAWSIDETSIEMLDMLASGRGTAESRAKRCKSLVRNRIKKHLRRHEIVTAKVSRETRLVELASSADAAAQAEELAHVKAASSALEWELLLAVASGETYESISDRLGQNVSTVKSQVSRCRHRLGKCA